MLIIGAVLAYAATFLQHGRGYSLLADGILGNLVMGLGGLVCLVRAALVRPVVAAEVLRMTRLDWAALDDRIELVNAR